MSTALLLSNNLPNTAMKGDVAACRAFIERGDNVNATYGQGWTALHYAAWAGRVAVCRMLIDAGANINATNRLGQTPLHQAAFHGRVGVCRLLVNRRADVNATDHNGSTPLHHGALYGRVEVCRLLIDQGANIYITDNNDKTPLDLAIEHHSVEVLTYFYVHGVVDFQAPDHTGVRPWYRLTEAERVTLDQAVRDRVHTILALRSTVLPKELSNDIMRYL